MILHSPKNFGGTRSRPDNKVLFMLGLSVHAMYLFIDLRTALTDCQIVVAVVRDIYDCKTAQDVADIPAPKENCLIGFEGSSIFIPDLVLRNTILASGSGKNQPFELIPIVTDAARNFDSDHEEDKTMTSLALSYPCRWPQCQCMALQCKRGLDQQNQIPNKTLQHGNHHDFFARNV